MATIKQLAERRSRLRADLADVEAEIKSRHGEDPAPKAKPKAKPETKPKPKATGG